MLFGLMRRSFWSNAQPADQRCYTMTFAHLSQPHGLQETVLEHFHIHWSNFLPPGQFFQKFRRYDEAAATRRSRPNWLRHLFLPCFNEVVQSPATKSAWQAAGSASSPAQHS